MAAIIVGPYRVDATMCDHNAAPPICMCIHDWRIAGSPGGANVVDGTGAPDYFGNVEYTGTAASDGD